MSRLRGVELSNLGYEIENNYPAWDKNVTFVKPRKSATQDALLKAATSELIYGPFGYPWQEKENQRRIISNMSNDISQYVSQGMKTDAAIQKIRDMLPNIEDDPYAVAIRENTNFMLDNISEHINNASTREYDPWLQEQRGGYTSLEPENSTDTAPKISEIFKWADERGLDLGRAATWYDEPIQFTNFKNERKEIKQLIYDRVGGSKAGIHLNNRLNKILEDTADADKEIARAKYPRYAGLDTFFNDLKSSYEMSRLRGAKLANLKYEILSDYPEQKKAAAKPIGRSILIPEDEHMSTSPDLGEHEHNHRQGSRTAKMNTAKRADLASRSNPNKSIYLPKVNNSDKVRDLSALSMNTVSSRNATDSSVVRHAVDKARRPVVYGSDPAVESDSSALSTTTRERLKKPVTTNFTSDGSVIQSAPSVKPHEEVRKQVKQKKEKPFESEIFSGGITPKPKPEIQSISESMSISDSGKYSATRKIHPTVEKQDSQDQFKSKKTKQPVTKVHHMLSENSDSASISSSSSTASIASINGNIVRRPMLSENSESYEVGEKKTRLRQSKPSTIESESGNKLSLLSESLSSSYERGERKTALESSASQSYEYSNPRSKLTNSKPRAFEAPPDPTIIRKRVRSTEDGEVEGGTSISKLKRRVNDIYKIVSTTGGGGFAGRPSANPLQGILKRNPYV